MTTPRDDEPPRDAWLREALRHAPDADAAPPAELSAAILRHARDAVKSAARPAASSHPLLRLRSWLARPPVAAGFATVMVATLVGVMWWDKPLDETLPRSEPPAATVAQSSAPAPAPASIATPLAAAAPPRAPEEAAKAATRAAKEAAPATPARRDDARERASTERARSAAPAAAPPPPAASPAPAPAPAPANESPAKPASADARDDAAAQRGAAAQGFAKAAPAPAPAAAPAQRRQEAATLTPVIDQPERWTWQRGGAEQAMTPGLQRWLVQLDRAVRWQPADAAPPATGVVVLRLWRDGALHATLQLGSDTAWLTPAGGAPVMAPLSPATSAALQAALIAATP
jgi:hypothetical protein